MLQRVLVGLVTVSGFSTIHIPQIPPHLLEMKNVRISESVLKDVHLAIPSCILCRVKQIGGANGVLHIGSV